MKIMAGRESMAEIYSIPQNKTNDLYFIELNGRRVPCLRCFVKGKSFAAGNVDLDYDYYEYTKEEAAFCRFAIRRGETATLTVLPNPALLTGRSGAAEGLVQPAAGGEIGRQTSPGPGEGASRACGAETDCESRISDVAIRPRSRNFRYRVQGEKIVIYDLRPGQFTVEVNGFCHALHVFIDDEEKVLTEETALYSAAQEAGYENFPERIPAKNGGTVLFFPAGEYEAEQIRMYSGDTLFLASGAWVHGSVREEGVKNIRIAGAGILDRTTEYNPGTRGGVAAAPHAVHFEFSENIKIENITVLDSPMWTITVSGCDNVDVENVKMIGMWAGSTDGLDVVNSANVRLTDSFFRSGDDCVTLKGFRPYQDKNVENILVSGCVFWCDWGVALQIGAEAMAKYYRNIAFSDCDIIHSAQAAISFQAGGYAEISNVTYDDIRVEYSARARRPLLYIGVDETTVIAGDQKSSDGGETFVSAGDVAAGDYVDELFAPIVKPKAELYGVRYEPENAPYAGWLIHVEICTQWHDILCRDRPNAKIDGVKFRNIAVWKEEGVPVPPSKIKGETAEADTKNVWIENLTVNGRRAQNFRDANLEIGPFTDGIRLW